jgi:hypothetical protein
MRMATAEKPDEINEKKARDKKKSETRDRS